MHARYAMITKKRRTDRVLNNLFSGFSSIPYLARRSRTPVAVYALGGIGLVLSGIAALMCMSPRTRSRAIDAAKGTFGKVNERILHRRQRCAEGAPPSDGERVEPPVTTM